MSVEQLINEFPEVTEIVGKWRDAAILNTIDVNEATTKIQQKGGINE